jgi:steroid delta-isomerase-like uncharacterized protein
VESVGAGAGWMSRRKGSTVAGNSALLRRWFDSLWNRRDLSVIDELLSPTAVLRAEPGAVFNGPADFKAFAQAVLATFSNIRMTVEETIEQDDRVALRWTNRAVHSEQPWEGIAPSNKEVAVTGITIVHFRDGKIVAGWEFWDAAGLKQQLSG